MSKNQGGDGSSNTVAAVEWEAIYLRGYTEEFRQNNKTFYHLLPRSGSTEINGEHWFSFMDKTRAY